jgi:hypothetical protein
LSRFGFAFGVNEIESTKFQNGAAASPPGKSGLAIRLLPLLFGVHLRACCPVRAPHKPEPSYRTVQLFLPKRSGVRRPLGGSRAFPEVQAGGQLEAQLRPKLPRHSETSRSSEQISYPAVPNRSVDGRCSTCESGQAQAIAAGQRRAPQIYYPMPALDRGRPKKHP